MEKLEIAVEDIESSAQYSETAKMLQDVYDRTGFIPSIFDCISPPETEGKIEVCGDNGIVRDVEPNEVDLWVSERWLHRDGKTLVLWVTTEIISPVKVSSNGKQINH